MKKVIAKTNAAGATVFYADGKRVSRAQLAERFASELYMNQFIRRKIPQIGSFLVEMWGARQVENVDGSTAEIEFQLSLNVDTVSDGLKIALAAVKNPDVYKAMIYDRQEYHRDYRLWGYPSAIGICSGKVWLTQTWGRVYQSYLDELAAQNFQPIIACNEARAKSQALTAERKEIEKRERAAWKEEMNAQDARDAAVKKHLQSFIA